MINNFIADQIRANFGFEPTFEQSTVIGQLSDFLLSSEPAGCFLLHGFAGTGKTTLVGALVRTLDALGQHVVLMAPTGRAAKVFALHSGHDAYTIHRRIYRQKSLATNDALFSLSENKARNTLFIVDEASMISDDGYGSSFGSGRLLDDLISFVYQGEGCRLMMMGDTAQLPPVGQEESPALSADVLRQYGLSVFGAELTQVMRQGDVSGILEDATAIRERIGLMAAQPFSTTLRSPLKLKCFPDVVSISGAELIDTLIDCYDHIGMDDTIVICRSNKNANIYNRGIRATILYYEEELNTRDQVMIVKNNYFWVKQNAQAAPLQADETETQRVPTFLANGDMAVIRRVRRVREMYGFRYADVLLSFPDYDDYELQATVLLNTLTSESPSMTKDENDRLFNAVMEDYQDIPNKAERYKQLRENPYFNALQIKFSYAVTCHKAQGGQWSTVILDQGWLPPESIGTKEYYRWLYTAFTRATDRVYLVNWRKEELEKE